MSDPTQPIGSFPQPPQLQPQEGITLLELDQRLGLPKGSAFRAFRARDLHWQEGRDWLVLHHEQDREAIEALRRAGRIYASTVNLLLLSPPLAEAVAAQMRRSTTDPAE